MVRGLKVLRSGSQREIGVIEYIFARLRHHPYLLRRVDVIVAPAHQVPALPVHSAWYNGCGRIRAASLEQAISLLIRRVWSERKWRCAGIRSFEDIFDHPMHWRRVKLHTSCLGSPSNEAL